MRPGSYRKLWTVLASQDSCENVRADARMSANSFQSVATCDKIAELSEGAILPHCLLHLTENDSIVYGLT